MKKLLSFFLSIALLSTLSFTAYATEVAPSVPQEHAIPSIPEEISFSHNRIIKGVWFRHYMSFTNGKSE
jgi:hypothetical protein